uniref:Putative secreted protein n=1 Tax=Panstrongylus lignarius TaxID=156445 RepID=A0A224Y0L3_9HEMI
MYRCNGKMCGSKVAMLLLHSSIFLFRSALSTLCPNCAKFNRLESNEEPWSELLSLGFFMWPIVPHAPLDSSTSLFVSLNDFESWCIRNGGGIKLEYSGLSLAIERFLSAVGGSLSIGLSTDLLVDMKYFSCMESSSSSNCTEICVC